MRAVRHRLLRLAGQLGSIVVPPVPRHASPGRIVVIKPDHLGDVLLLTPALDALRRSFPQAHIMLLIGPWSAAAVRGNWSIDSVQICAFPGFTRQPKPHLLQPYLLLLKMALLLHNGRYDVALVARDDHWWGALLALAAGIPRRIGYAAPDTAPLLSEALPYDPRMHVARQGLALAAHLAGESHVTLMGTVAPITADDQQWAEWWLQAHGCLSGERLIAIHPGAGGGAKLWHSLYWVAVIDTLMRRGARVIVTGGTGERAMVESIAQRTAAPPLLLVGDASLGELAAVYARCDLVLGVDSGPLHLATATRTRTIALFGPIDHERFGPWGTAERHRVVRSSLWCSPCKAVDVCPRGTQPSECMTTISVAQVLAAVDAMAREEASNAKTRRDNI